MDRAKLGIDNSLFRTPKERLGQEWSHTKETKKKLAADKAAEKNEVFIAPEYDTKPSQNAGALRPKNTKHGLQQLNGRRTQCKGYKAGAKIGKERNLPPVPKDYVAVARAKRVKIQTAKVRPAPTK